LTTPWLTGFAEPNAKVELLVTVGSGGSAVTHTYAGATNASGVWSLQITDTLPAGTYVPQLRVTDAANNAHTQALDSFEVDTTGPKVVISGLPAQMKGGDKATITFTFDADPGTSFVRDDITLTNGTITAPQVDANNPLVYTAEFTPSSGLASGTVGVALANGKFTDAAGNSNTDGAEADNNLTANIDSLAPTVSAVTLHGLANSTLADKTNLVAGDWVEVRVQFSEIVTVAGGTPSFNIVFNNNATRAAQYVSGSGTDTLRLRYQIEAGITDDLGGITAPINGLSLPGITTVRDGAGNDANIAAPAVVAGTNLLKIDTTAPEVTISRDDSFTKLNKVNEAILRFTFTETPVGFDRDDIVLGGSGGTLGTTLSGPLTEVGGLGRTYYTITLKATDSTTTAALVSVNGARFKDAFANDNTASNTLSLPVDTVALTVPSGKLAAASDTGNGNVGTTADQITNLPNPRLRGTADKGAQVTVELTVNGALPTTAPVSGKSRSPTLSSTGSPTPPKSSRRMPHSTPLTH
jgi:hypothetical protein